MVITDPRIVEFRCLRKSGILKAHPIPTNLTNLLVSRSTWKVIFYSALAGLCSPVLRPFEPITPFLPSHSAQ